MKIDWTARGTKVPDALRERVDAQLDKVNRLLHGEVEARVVVTQQGENHTGLARQAMEIVLRSKLGTHTAHAESHDLDEAANVAIKRIEKRVRRAHDKIVDGRKKMEAEVAVPEIASSD